MHRSCITTTNNVHCARGKGDHVILFQSVPISKAACLRYSQTSFPSSVGHENFKSGICCPSTPLQVIKQKWPAGLKRNLGERRDQGWRERQGWSLSIITLMKKDQKKPGEEIKKKSVKRTKINPSRKPSKTKTSHIQKENKKRWKLQWDRKRKSCMFKKCPWQTHGTDRTGSPLLRQSLAT